MFGGVCYKQRHFTQSFQGSSRLSTGTLAVETRRTFDPPMHVSMQTRTELTYGTALGSFLPFSSLIFNFFLTKKIPFL